MKEDRTRDSHERLGIYKPLFGDNCEYLSLLHLSESEESKRAISLIVKCSASAGIAYREICYFLRQNNWRPHLVGAVALATLPQNDRATDQLWSTIDRGSWVSPQLVAVAFLRDPKFADRAAERLQSWASKTRGSGSPFGEEPIKAVAGLLRFMKLLPHPPDAPVAGISESDLLGSCNEDLEFLGTLAEQWLQRFRRHLVDLGIAAPDGTLRH